MSSIYGAPSICPQLTHFAMFIRLPTKFSMKLFRSEDQVLSQTYLIEEDSCVNEITMISLNFE